MINFESYVDCKQELTSLKEAINYIKNNLNPSDNIYNTFCGGNLIILGTFFESFNENIVQEYVDKIMVEFNNNKLLFRELPEKMQEFISNSLIRKHHKKDFDSMYFREASSMTIKIMKSLRDNTFIINDELDNINKFSFGKHGENEVKKIFKRVGIDLSSRFNNFTELNNYFNLRNNLIHPESIGLIRTTPPDIEDVEKYLKYMRIYIRKINRILNDEFSLLPIRT